MVARILSEVRLGNFVCAAYYGHPGVFAFPTHESIRQARAEGYSARMLPAVSAEDWLFADFGVDPSTSGCQSFETTDFLINRRRHDPTSHLILWQVGVVGALDFRWRYDYRKNLDVLTEQLLRHYNSDHRVALYRINPIPICDPDIEWMRLTDLPTASLTASSTLLVPPRATRIADVDMMRRLDMPERSDTYRVLTRDDAGETSAPGGGGVPELAHRLPVGAVQQLGARVGPPLRRDSEDSAATQRAPCGRSRTHSSRCPGPGSRGVAVHGVAVRPGRHCAGRAVCAPGARCRSAAPSWST